MTTIVPSLAPLASPAELLDAARALASERDHWLALVQHHPAERWFLRVHADAAHDVWLIGWDSFQGVDLHDHGGASGAFYVVDGELQETSTTRHRPGPVVEQTVAAGTARAFGADHVHRVVNRTARPATSLHLYSPPLVSMDFYRPHGAGLAHVHREDALAPRSGAGELR